MRCLIIVILAAATQASPLLFNTNARGGGGGVTGLLGNLGGIGSIASPVTSVFNNLPVAGGLFNSAGGVVSGLPVVGGIAQGVLPTDPSAVRNMQSISKDLTILFALGQEALEKSGNTNFGAVQGFGNQLQFFFNLAPSILTGGLKDILSLPGSILGGTDLKKVLGNCTPFTDLAQVVQEFVRAAEQAKFTRNKSAADHIIDRLMSFDEAKLYEMRNWINPIATLMNAALSVLVDRVYNNRVLSNAVIDGAEAQRLLNACYPLSTLADTTREVVETGIRAKVTNDRRSLSNVVDRFLSFDDAMFKQLFGIVNPLATIMSIVPSILQDLIQNIGGLVTSVVPVLPLAGK